ncbi:MAG: lipase maturation factor family protein, partial [Candidatus Obscuribacterales bacterium]|nr:lipase maturation factor family protein [Candidatus Obscuribacterales bacterium]
MAQIRANSHLYVRWLFIRILCFCFFAAFLSIAVQIVGLYGQHGILPLSEVLAQFTNPETKLLAMLTNPSIFWFNSSDNFMRLVCFSGAGLSVLAFCGFFTGPLIAVMWFLYLSIVSLGQEFMGFQWDSLLLETSLIAIWFAPWSAKEIHPFRKEAFESQAEPSYIFLFLLRLLCFKLMIFSGICKLASGDVAWSDLSAMSYHYETQPLPTPLSWL